MARFMRPIFTRATIFWGDVSISVHSGRFTTLESTDPPLKNTTLNSSSLPQTIPDRALKNISQMQISHARTRMIGLSFQLDKRFFSGESSDLDYTHEIDEINAKFAEAREEIDMALESKETVYFDEEAETAKAAVKVALDMFNALLAKLPDAERGAVQRSMGLKMEQLKAELEQLNE